MVTRILALVVLLIMASTMAPFAAQGARQTGDLVVNEPTEVFSDDGEVVWQGAPGEIYRVLAVDADWALVTVGTDADALIGWVQVDARVTLRTTEVAAPPPPVPPAQPTPTVVPTPGPGTVLLSEDFSDPSRATLPRTSVTENRSAGYVDGEYEIRSGRSDNNLVFVAVTVGNYRDVSVAADVRAYGGPQGRSVGLSCRNAANAANGEYRIRVLVEQQLVRILRGGQLLVEAPSQAIRRGEAVNRIELWCVGSTITAIVNGVTVATTQDAALQDPGAVQLGVAGSGSTARFDNLVITQR